MVNYFPPTGHCLNWQSKGSLRFQNMWLELLLWLMRHFCRKHWPYVNTGPFHHFLSLSSILWESSYTALSQYQLTREGASKHGVICYGFYWSIQKNGQHWAKKLIFQLILWPFFVYALLHPMTFDTHRFFQMKNLVKIDICDKFHQYSICGCQI